MVGKRAIICLLAVASCQHLGCHREITEPVRGDAEVAAERLAAAMCRAYFDCACSSQIFASHFGDLETCRAVREDELLAYLQQIEESAGKIDLTCVDEVAESFLSCGASPTCAVALGSGAEGDLCSGFVLDQLGQGSTCTAGLLCIGGTCSAGSSAKADVGESCRDPYRACSDVDAFCSDSTTVCEPKYGGPGDPCHDKSACVFGLPDTNLYCRGLAEGPGTCEERLPLGAPCDERDFRPCALHCVADDCFEQVCFDGQCVLEDPPFCDGAPVVLE